MRSSILSTLICGAFALVAACGTTHGGGDDTATGDTLVVSPPTSTLTITDDSMPATQAFTATLMHSDGTSEDVTANTTFSTDSDAGSFVGPMMTIDVAGKTAVIGTYTPPSTMQVTGTAEVIVMIQTVRVDPTLPAGTPALFGAATEDPTRVPTVVYPATGVIVPRNLGDFEVHWKDSSTSNVYQVSLQTTYSNIVAYVPATTPSATPATTPTTAWMAFLASEWLDAVGGETAVTFQVRGLDMANPATVGSTAPQQVQLSNEEMLGGLYYWATASTTGIYGVFRHDMSMPGQPATKYLTSDIAPDGHACVACHVLSRDGKNMAITFDGGGGISTLVDVATTTPQTPANHWDFATFTPDGTELIAVEGNSMVVRKYADQSVITTLNAGTYSTHPDMSPDGTELVYVKPTANLAADYQFDAGEIFIAAFDQTTNTLGAPRPLVSDTYNNYYPTFSPDGQWVLYTRATDGTQQGTTGHYSYNNQTAELCVINVAAGSTPIVLATSNDAANLTNSWGRWAPFAQTFGVNDESMNWITWSSKRDFGVRRINSTVGFDQQVPQLWMSPFFPDRAAMNMDPSAPAFRLPFQDFDSSNHIAQWTEQIVVVANKPPEGVVKHYPSAKLPAAPVLAR